MTACFARDALEDQSVEAAAGGALEGLISLAQGKPADRGIIFAPGFRTEPTVDYDVTIPLSLDDVLSTLHSAIKVDYRRRGGSNQDGYAFRYVTRERLLDSCGSAMHVCTYEVYQCREFNARMQFDGPLQAFRLVAIGRGRMDRATILHSIENAGSQEAQSRRITQSRERKPDGGTGSPATVPHAVK